MAKSKAGRRNKRRGGQATTRRATGRVKRTSRRAVTRRAKPKARRVTQRAKPKARSAAPKARRATAATRRAKPATQAKQKRVTTPHKAVAAKPSRPAAPAPPVKSARAARVHRPGAPPALARPRRLLEDVVPTPPSSLDLDRHASAVRTGHAELMERLENHHETGPALTGGDIDADWEEAYSSGEEAPGGDNPTPDQSVVEDIGRSLGVEYDDSEELTGGGKVEDRDRKRWELDPASSEDYRGRK